MAGKILQIRSLVPGKVPLTSSLLAGEIAINVPDGKAYLRKSGSAGDVITSFVTTDSTTTGSIHISGTVSASQFSGSGADLYDISASAIIGLSLGKMATGSVTASVDQTNGFTVTSLASGSTFSGSINIISGTINMLNSGSGENIYGTASWALNAVNGGGGAATLVSATLPPTTSISGTLWFNTTNGNTFVQIDSPTGSNFVPATSLMSTGSVTASIHQTNGFIVNSIPSGSEFSGSLFVSGGVIVMSSSGENVFGTASYAISASIAYTTVVQAGASKIATVATASLTWSLTHNLGTLYPNVDIYRYDNTIIIPRTIRSVNVNTTEVTFTTPMSGTVVTTVGGGMPPISTSFANYVLQVDNNGLSAAWKSAITISGSMQYAETASYSTGFRVDDGTGSAQFEVYGTSSFYGPVSINNNPVNGAYKTNFPSPSDTWSINHNLDSTTLMVQVFDLNDNMFFPDQITMTDSNNTTILIGLPKAGYVVIK